MAGSASSDDGDIGFQIAPMVDVVFVLMLFFMASAGSRVTERELRINLPSFAQNSSYPRQEATIIIDISEEGQVTMNNTPFGTPADRNLQPLRDWLKNAIEQFGGGDPSSSAPIRKQSTSESWMC